MANRVNMLNLSADIAASAARISATQVDKVQEEVDWDVNLQSSEKRLKPYKYELRQGGIIEIQQSSVPTNEPGAPASGTGSAIWTASIGLARFLEWKLSNSTEEVDKYHCIELGCGTGLVSLLLASLGAKVVTTDIIDCVEQHTIPNMEANKTSLSAQGYPLKGEVDVQELVWGSTPLQPFGNSWNLVVASDVIYRSEHVPLLLSTLQALVGIDSVCYVSFDKRGREGIEAFLSLVKDEESGFHMREVSESEMPSGYRFTQLGIIELTKRRS